ncbi:MAG: helix-turn-helix domain-containing protein [Candidatus Izemoplasmataceae bacterium]
MKDIAKTIKEGRIKKGLSQQELADQLFITKQSISKYENSHALPSEDILEKLEHILDIELDEKANGWIISKRQKRIGTMLLIFMILVIVSLSVTTTTLFLRYKELESKYSELTRNNILDYSGVQIIYDGSYQAEFDEFLFFTSMTVTNPTNAPFMFDSDLVTIKLKFVSEDEIVERRSISEMDTGVSSSATLRAEIKFYMDAPTDRTIEWFEIYYGGMFVAKEFLN